jgi:hypothetical protein
VVLIKAAKVTTTSDSKNTTVAATVRATGDGEASGGRAAAFDGASGGETEAGRENDGVGAAAGSPHHGQSVKPSGMSLAQWWHFIVDANFRLKRLARISWLKNDRPRRTNGGDEFTG